MASTSKTQTIISSLLFIFLCCQPLLAQILAPETLAAKHDQYRVKSLEDRRIKHRDIQPLIDQYRQKPQFKVHRVGASVEGRPLHLLSTGTGPTQVFLWSQMHGDESTATMAIFDVLAFLSDPANQSITEPIRQKLSIHFLPMLNPDGAEVFDRRNKLGMDLNRDALRLQAPESKVLKRIRDSLQADFGFNLHDQSRYYNAAFTPKPATVSFLATAFNEAKDINETRKKSMQLIVRMNEVLQVLAPGQVGRYDDTFEPRAFGDNIQKWGTSLVLIESGGYQNDLEKQVIRQLNFVTIISALSAIGDESYAQEDHQDYFDIPMNDRKLFDLKIKEVNQAWKDWRGVTDIGIQRIEVDDPAHETFYHKSQIIDLGDLSTYYGYEEFDARGYDLVVGKKYIPQSTDPKIPSKAQAIAWLKKGYLYWQVAQAPNDLKVDVPMFLVSPKFVVPDNSLYLGKNPNFLLRKNGVITHAIVNGYLIDLSQEVDNFRNALYLR
jgi:hypothetical protein